MEDSFDQPTRGRDNIEEAGLQSYRLRRGWLNRLKRKLWPPTPCLDIGGRLRETLAALSPEARLLEVGNGGRRLRPNAINLDIGPYAEVDTIGDGTRMPFAHGSFDAAVCQGVLEHIPEPQAVVRNMLDVLRPGGIVYAEVPFIQGFHADPSDFQRYTIKGIDFLFRDFEKLSSGTCVGPSSALAWVLREYMATFFGAGRARAVASHIFGWLTFWIKYGDYLLIRNPEAHRIASAVFFLGRKPELTGT